MKTLITPKNLFYAGCCFSTYSLCQLLGIIMRGFPNNRIGAIIIAVILLLSILAIGFCNWCGLWYQSGGYLKKHQTLVGFGFVYVVGTFVIVALTTGFLIGA